MSPTDIIFLVGVLVGCLGERGQARLRIVEEGLNPGDRVIVNGIQKVSVGMPVTAQDIEMAPAGRQNAQASE